MNEPTGEAELQINLQIQIVWSLERMFQFHRSIDKIFNRMKGDRKIKHDN